MKLKITQVEALLSTRLRITWENGIHTEVDAADYLQARGYERLRDPAIQSLSSQRDKHEGI